MKLGIPIANRGIRCPPTLSRVVSHASVNLTFPYGPRLAACGGSAAASINCSLTSLPSGRNPPTLPRSKPTLSLIYAAASDPSRSPHVAAAAAASSSSNTRKGPIGLFLAAHKSIKDQFSRLEGLWDKFIPMALLFFLMAFINTIIDSLKDSLVITAVGGGTEVLPYLSVYGVLPSSVLFLVAYSWGTQRFSRERLFNFIICGFLAFYGTFAYVYPHHETLHLSTWADSLALWLPAGFSGFVGMARNWLFTLFYCFSELWGDVALSLLFWGLANETTSIEDAPLLYPLFGIGANVAQTLAGRALRVFSDASGVHMSYTHQLQGTISLCVCLGVVVLGLHAFISKTFPINPKGSTLERIKKEKALQVARDAKAAAAAAAAAAVEGETSEERLQRMKIDLEATVRGMNYCDVEEHAHSTTNFSSTTADTSAPSQSPPPATPRKKTMTMKDAFIFLGKSPQIRCLAMMALAQGITTRLLDVTWKHYLHKLHTTPAAYAAFLGDTAMWTGIVTGSLMFMSPMLFDRIRWEGVASTTPNFMFWGGIPFFIGCIAYNFMADKALAVGAFTLQGLVIAGAVLQVLSKGSKFSLFKPAEEMVYIGLDDESRSKGKAAIDVVGAQSGKSVVSVMQQALLILTGGTVGGILPMLAVFYAFMLHRWIGAVEDLAEHYDPAHVHRRSVMGSIDEDDGNEGIGGGGGSNGNGSGESASSNYDIPSPAAA